MVSISHDEAVSILKSVQETAQLKVEKNAINTSSQMNTTDEEDIVSCLVFVNDLSIIHSFHSPQILLNVL